MTPPHLHLLQQSNSSQYTLATVHSLSPTTAHSTHDDLTPLLTPAPSSSYGATFPRSPAVPNARRVILNAALKMALIFLVSTAVLGGTLWLALPTIDDDDRPMLRIPKSFAQLQDLNSLLKKYRDIYPYRIVVCYVTTYLFLQAFSLPGSMYLSILGGAMWGVPRALLLACACVATGATLCYLISAALGPALLTLPKFQSRLETWGSKIQSQKDNLISFLIVLRIAPLPPHWVVNVLCPHLGIGLLPFWISTFLGILGVTVIHTTIGGGLDEMTSADDFHLISWRNFLGLSAVVVGVLIPVGLRYYFKRELAVAAEVEQAEEADETEFEEGPNQGDRILEVGPQYKGKTQQLVMLSDEEDFFDDSDEEEDDEDIILEAGPALMLKPKVDQDIESNHDVRDL